MNCELHLSNAQTSSYVASLSVTGCIGAVVGGPFNDRYGRKAAIILISALMAAGWSLMLPLRAMGSAAFLALVASRCLLGLAAGVCNTIIPIYLSEVAPARLRGAMGTSCVLSRTNQQHTRSSAHRDRTLTARLWCL